VARLFYCHALPLIYRRLGIGGSHMTSYNDVGSVKRQFSVHLPKCFFFDPKSFSAAKVRARIVRWNRRGSTSHLFDPNPRQDHDYLFKLPNALGEAGCPTNKPVSTTTT
jgi:hypothetical protein